MKGQSYDEAVSAVRMFEHEKVRQDKHSGLVETCQLTVSVVERNQASLGVSGNYVTEPCVSIGFK